MRSQFATMFFTGLLCLITTHAQSQTIYNVWPLGNSVTEGEGTSDYSGYRRSLYEKLSYTADQNGVSLNFVGTTTSGNNDFDDDHDGHAGWKTAEIRDNVGTWLDMLDKKNELPNIVLFHIGTNDISSEHHPDLIK